MPSDTQVALAAARKQALDDWHRAQQSLAQYMALAEGSDQRETLKLFLDPNIVKAGPSFTAVVGAANGRKRAAESDDEDTDGKTKGKRGIKKVKKDKDPNAPKRPASAFILFQNAVRSEMKAAHPDLEYKELARQIGDRWKNMSDEEKKPWSDAGKAAMDEYSSQRKEYEAAHPDGSPVVTRVSPGGADGADGEKPKKKRGRPSNAELAARAAAAGGDAAPVSEKKKAAAPTSASKKSSAPPPVESSDEDTEASSEESSDSEAAAAAVAKKTVPAAAATTAESSEESSEASSDSEVAAAPKRTPVAAAPVSPAKAKVAKVVKSSDKKIRK